MKLNNLYKHYNVLNESSSRQDITLNYSLNVSVDDAKFKAKGAGSLRIPKDVYQYILSVEDVINYIIKEEAKGAKTDASHDGVSSKDILSQMLFAFMNKENAKYLSAKDEVQFTFDYGPSDSNCIGLFISKSLGSPAFSSVMRLNKQALPNEFNKEAMDARILMYSSVSETK